MTSGSAVGTATNTTAMVMDINNWVTIPTAFSFVIHERASLAAS